MSQAYIVKRKLHYNSEVETVHVALTRKAAEIYIENNKNRLMPGGQLYISTGGAYDPDEIDTSKQEV